MTDPRRNYIHTRDGPARRRRRRQRVPHAVMAAGVGGVVSVLRAQSTKRARARNLQCPLLRLLSQSDDLRDAILSSQLQHYGLVTLWRLTAVSTQWRDWVHEAMRHLPTLLVQGQGQGHSCCLFALSFDQMRWTALPRTVVVGRQSHAVCSTASGEIVLAGGTKKTELLEEHPLGNHIDAGTPSVEVYCGGVWRTNPAIGLPTPVRRASMLSLHDGSLLLLGGFGEGGVARAEVWRLRLGDSGRGSSATVATPTVDSMCNSSASGCPAAPSVWEDRAPMHTARSDFACGVLPDGRVIVAGGLGNAPPDRPAHHQIMLQSAEIYDPVADRWSCLPRMRYPRSGCRGCVDKLGRFIVSGGRGVQEGPLTVPLDSIECFVPVRELDQAVADGRRAVGRWIEYGWPVLRRCSARSDVNDRETEKQSSVAGEEVLAAPPPLPFRSVGHSMVCIAGDLIVVGPAFASSIGGGGGSAREAPPPVCARARVRASVRPCLPACVRACVRACLRACLCAYQSHDSTVRSGGGVGSGISFGGGFGAMILMGTDHCPGRAPRWRKLRFPIPCRGRQCSALLAPLCVSPSAPLCVTEIERGWRALTKLRAVKLCVELLTQRDSSAHAQTETELTGPLVAFSAMVAEEDRERSQAEKDKEKVTDGVAALFRSPVLCRSRLLQGLRTAGATAALGRWCTPSSVCVYSAAPF